MAKTGFHTSNDSDVSRLPDPTLAVQLASMTHEPLRFHFATHFHPYVGALMQRLLTGSLRGLQTADTEYVGNGIGRKPVLFRELLPSYVPSDLVDNDRPPVAELDFDPDGAYAVYNWELFHYIPLTMAIHLSRNQRYAESQRWFHYIFDPTDSTNGPTPERFWGVKPFQTTDVQLIEEILVNLATGEDGDLKQKTVGAIDRWRADPYRPYLVARSPRLSASMLNAVMAYLDNVIAWGDNLFRQDTGETINEATQLYVLAANILGPRPQPVPRKGFVAPATYDKLRERLDEFGNAMVDMEAEIGLDLAPNPRPAATDKTTALRSAAAALYFCIPRNERLIGYWDTVADRLFKIRNSLNIQGIFRQLPLFEPPIDPALLARAAAAGLDIGAVVAGINQPLPLVRFSILVQKAQEICQEVKSLAANLLSAIEKEDGEALALLRARHEAAVLELARSVRHAQWHDAIKAREGVEVSLANTVNRYRYYEQLLGTKEADIKIPELEGLDDDGLLAKLNYSQGEPDEKSLEPSPLTVTIADDPGGLAAGRKLNREELEELVKLKEAYHPQQRALQAELTAAEWGQLPDFKVAYEPMGSGGAATYGMSNLVAIHSANARRASIEAHQFTYEAGRAGKLAAYARREQEWAFQTHVAAGEITQMFKHLRAAQIREAIAKREYENHEKQIEYAEEIQDFLSGERVGGSKKTSTKDLYAWMRREVRGLYGQCFQFAFDVARKAERALQHELGDPNRTFLQFGYQSGKEGLLAGERLYLDIKRMELAYHDLNHREYELTKHVSVRLLDPLALLQLRATGRCTVRLPEELFDLDCPGHYFRRIKSVAVSIPCVVGPYASVNCTLTLLKSSIRKSQQIGDGYLRAGEDTERFSDHFGSLQGIVTSTGQNDSGLFDVGGGDGRYLPFEGSGAISEWQLELPVTVSQFDPDTISDVILHVRYTAREGGAPLRDAAVANLREAIKAANAAGSVRLLSVRHDFPTEWAQFTSMHLGTGGMAKLKLTLREEHYPFWSRILTENGQRTIALTRMEMLAPPTGPKIEVYENASQADTPDELADSVTYGGRFGELGNPPAALGEFERYLTDNTMRDLWLALTWGEGV